ncbi:MAG: hypothetical protein AMS26_17300 [Bacteroides sp. SM23_62]|nr:MAG: hypothetical protein AMS26_17300 [Bacteroides sp. SM23_62]
MPGDGIHKCLKAAIQEKMFLLLDLTINDNDAFLENILRVIGASAIGDNKVMNGRIIVFIDILQYAVIAGLYPLYNFLNRKFTHFISCSGVLRHKTKKKTLTALRSKDIFDVQGRPEGYYATFDNSITSCLSVL